MATLMTVVDPIGACRLRCISLPETGRQHEASENSLPQIMLDRVSAAGNLLEPVLRLRPKTPSLP